MRSPFEWVEFLYSPTTVTNSLLTFEHVCANIGMYAAAKALSHVSQTESMKSVHNTLNNLGEKLPRALGDKSLHVDMINMNSILQNMDDEAILQLAETKEKRIIGLMRLYTLLGRVALTMNPALIGATGLRMIELTFESGLCSDTSLAFAYYGQTLATLGKYDLATRLGT